MSVARHLAVSVALLALVTSCLSSLPDAITCPAAARLPAATCPALPGAGVPPGSPGPDGCTLDGACLERQGRTCRCTAECSTTPTKDTCAPAPECPASLKAPNAICLVAEVHFAISNSCSCGCVSCASLCDGFGPIIGAGPAGSINVLFGERPTGRLGILVRARGSADLHGTLIGANPTALSAHVESTDEFTDVLFSPPVPLVPQQPTQGVMINSTSPIEIDCVVPYVMP